MSESSRCARTLIGQLLAQGVTDFVLAPGSRSAPLALCLEASAAAGLLRLHVRVDERSAGFLALGLAKGSSGCAAVVTTSGTAVGNLLPAVMEAHHAGVALLVVSADRPSWMVGFGANQTTEQSGIFAGFLSYSARVSALAPANSWTAQAARAVLLATGATGGRSGPAHLNVELPEPLVDAAESFAAIPATPVLAGKVPHAEPTRLSGTPRTLVICGDASPQTGRAAVALADSAGLPLVAEPSSNARGSRAAVSTGRLLLSGPLGARVERVVVFGRPTLSRPVNALLGRDGVEVVVVSDRSDFPDPGWRASLVAAAIEVEPGPSDWLVAWQQADVERQSRVAGLNQGERLSGPGLAALVMAGLPEGQVLCLGNSNAIRDADLAPIRTSMPLTYANRGLSGIDGTVSTAIGISLATGVPTTLLCGDLSFVHDVGGLVIGPGEPRPLLRVIVADDNGGSIFATLEYGRPEFAPAFERVFATPTGLDLVAMASAYGLPARRVSTAAQLSLALAEPITALDVLVVELDRARRADLARDVNQP